MKFKDGYDKMKLEVSIMKKLQHRNVIKLHEIIENEKSDKIFMILEYAE